MRQRGTRLIRNGLFIFSLLIVLQSQGQGNFTQTVKGYVTDAASKKPLAGVSVVFTPSGAHAVTDSNGHYKVNDLPLGRYSIAFSSVGYESSTLNDILVTSGKEMEQHAALIESFKSLNSIFVSSSRKKNTPINEFATLSARSFSIEETKRYPASFSDPARMVMNFPGVSAANDGENSIVVRGNSPSGVLWKLEGIEIPTPNHFSNLGSTGGPVSMLSSNVIGKSDFYTGAFPAEIGNATSAAFDVNFRNGNKDRAEHSVMLGALGIELSTEGPLTKKHTGSYLVNYRYSTLAILKNFIKLDGIPDYQDLSFKFNWQTPKAGEFTVFGLGGYNTYGTKAEKDSSKWTSDDPNAGYSGNSLLGIAGISHQIFINPHTYFKSVLSGSYSRMRGYSDTLNPAENQYTVAPTGKERFINSAVRFSTYYNNKIDSRNTIRTGIVLQHLNYDLNNHYYDDAENTWKRVLDGNGNTNFYQAFFQWKFRLTDRISFNSGIHSSYLALNKKHSFEPRASVSYTIKAQTISLAAGVHARPEHISTYLFDNKTDHEIPTYPNKQLDLSRAMHIVAGYERFFSSMNLKAKAEVYYQHLYKIPVEVSAAGGFSTINMESVYDLQNTGRLISKGTGRNYGVDLSLERPFTQNYYFMATGSLFRSTYKDYNGDEYNTRYGRNYTFNLIGGKEWQSNKNPNKLIGASAKLLGAGGLRTSVIDLPASVISGKQELVPGQYFTRQAPAYFRLDASVYIKKDRQRSTHIIALEFQNLTGRENVYGDYFDSRSESIKTFHQIGLLPNISYKIQFH